jgi:hypothetical protein
MTDPASTPRPAAWKLGSDAARAVGLFRPEGPLGYRAKYSADAPLRATRAEAEADQLAYLEQRSAQAKGGA